MKPRFPESVEERAARLLRTARSLAGGNDGALESAAPRLPKAARVAARLSRNLSASGVPRAVADPAAKRAAREGIEMIRGAGRGDVRLPDLKQAQLSALEAVIQVIGRPSWLVRGGQPVLDSADPSDTSWEMDIQNQFLKIPQASRSVGVIRKKSGDVAAIGTGWVLAPRLVVTNAHVARHLYYRKVPVSVGDPAGGWRPRPGVTGEIDFSFENGRAVTSSFPLAGLCFIEAGAGPDLAILALAPAAGQQQPARLSVCYKSDRTGGWQGAHIFVLGHPLGDLQDDPNVPLVFPAIDGTKRLSPGEVLDLLGGGEVLSHDCSTINGSSGSPVIDFTSMEVIGLHYFGRPGDRNEAVFMPAIKDHPAIRRAVAGGFDV